MSSQSALKKRLKVLMNKPENQQCVDCPEKQPRWASLIKVPGAPPGTPAIGAFMCLECSGSHRRLGVHIAFVRSVNLDSWKEKEVQSMERGGNRRVNQIFEAHLARSGVRKPAQTANGQQRERYIRDKYERRKFYDPSAWENLEYSSEEEEPAPRKRSTKSTSTKPVIAPRAPSAAAQRRLASRQARLDASAPAPAPVARKTAAPKPAEPTMDLLDFSSAPTAPPAGPPAPSPAAQQETLDLFANMSVSNAPSAPQQQPTASAAPAQPATKSNDDIMSLFQSASPVGNGMPVMAPGMNQAFVQQNQLPQMQQPQMQQQMQQQQQQQPQMNMGAMQNGMAGMTPQQMQMQQQMMMQQMMMMQQQAAMQQQRGGNAAAQMNPMMYQQANMAGMQQQQMPQQTAGMNQMNMRGMPGASNVNQMGGFGGPAMGGQAMGTQQQQQPSPKMTTKEDPFASLGATNRFR
uniref:Arf-GAP domain-containing protein n=1 Tax=Grammatophora oceanica TaxID=210454 RepID=A0A7S1URI9_9STRA|mmetsp:Transcript_16258/g.24081  ORF Transcript_16258/g.24081 Transcript_16258/m.24081 type:complete len:462 (+) Transcript_16258:92-1477(+)|eukprot:CAMPEP_0194037940 /NCGR_PEP_ID=MMETSP0009_2-20130614/10245_1 /TAXON_ID=210454 /ORGANISM="Grammatophora oceanica, Strain CCMP 410" /LENGTH=461 /DNA_ID=CAMNT_0038680289 /DNA_START=92 /DNA_END=1477 /DNA_ORIENTATION=-